MKRLLIKPQIYWCLTYNSVRNTTYQMRVGSSRGPAPTWARAVRAHGGLGLLPPRMLSLTDPAALRITLAENFAQVTFLQGSIMDDRTLQRLRMETYVNSPASTAVPAPTFHAHAGAGGSLLWQTS